MLLTPETLYFQLGRGEKDIHDSGPNASKERTRSRGSALRAKAGASAAGVAHSESQAW
jgi:hypothetical protein